MFDWPSTGVLVSVFRRREQKSWSACCTILDNLTKRGLRKPELAIVDGAPGLEKALASLCARLPIQRCTVHKLRNLIAHAPKKFAEEIAADYQDMLSAENAEAIAKKRKAFLNMWYVKCEAVAASLEEADDHLFTFKRLPVAKDPHARLAGAAATCAARSPTQNGRAPSFSARFGIERDLCGFFSASADAPIPWR